MADTVVYDLTVDYDNGDVVHATLTIDESDTTASKGTVTAISGTVIHNHNTYNITGLTDYTDGHGTADNLVYFASPYVDGSGLSFKTDEEEFYNLFDESGHYKIAEGTSSNTGTIYDASVTFQPACFCAGTLIDTVSGQKPVELLESGDLVRTTDGRAVPIRWIGRSTVSARFGDPLHVLPIRIKAGALGDQCPARDLLLSPEHAVLVDGLLIQAGALVNGSSIIREHNVPETFTYYHVECAEHVLLLAEGLAAESFVDNVSRMIFDNWEEHERRCGDTPVPEMTLPRAQSHRQVPKDIQHRLLLRAQQMFGLSAQTAA